MGDSSFGDETQYHPSEHSCNQHVSRYEYYRTSDVHGSTADSGSGHDKYENCYHNSYVQRISGDRHHDKSGSSECYEDVRGSPPQKQFGMSRAYMKSHDPLPALITILV